MTLLATTVPTVLPEPRGPLSEALLDHLVLPVHDVGPLPAATDHPIHGEDASVSLYLLYELHYRGLAGVDDEWEWEPSLLRHRRDLERAFEDALRSLVGPQPSGLTPTGAREALVALSTTSGGPSLSGFVESSATIEQVRELAVHRSAYQLKEADPHTWGIPRLSGEAKAAMVHIQRGEYGDGDPAAVHATLFAETMTALGLDAAYGALLDHVPATALSTCNLISFLGLHRRCRGALVGHLALFEMCSVGPMGRYSRALERLGLGPEARRFYDEHVEADALHEVIALDRMVAGLLEDEPELADDVVFGAAALTALEADFATGVLAAWRAGTTSLRRPLP